MRGLLEGSTAALGQILPFRLRRFTPVALKKMTGFRPVSSEARGRDLEPADGDPGPSAVDADECRVG